MSNLNPYQSPREPRQPPSNEWINYGPYGPPPKETSIQRKLFIAAAGILLVVGLIITAIMLSVD